MAVMFPPLLKWLSQNVIKRFWPGSYRLSFPNVTSIIDCTEFFIKKPRNPTAQSQTFSSYTAQYIQYIIEYYFNMFQNCGVNMYWIDTLPRIVDSWISSDQGMKLWMTEDFSLETFFLKREPN